MTAVPDLSAYNSAVQVPAAVFADQRLKAGAIATDPRGLPVANSGGFAIAFRLESGGTAWAVRCFSQLTPGLADRYRHVSEFTRVAAAPFLVPVEYVSQGIRVDGGWWPITVMPWIDGPNLNRWVADNLQHPKALASMRSAISSIVEEMERAGAAHGDLQHGNILVASGDRPFLVDYDGMYVPALAGEPPPEGGHPNYQHPERGSLPFGPDIDRYSAMVIWAALSILEVRPELWDRFDTGENLLFTAKDFADPESSALLAMLRTDKRSEAVGDRVQRVASLAAKRIPTLADFVAGRLPPAPSVRASPPRVAATAYPVVDLRKPDGLSGLQGRVIAIGEIVRKAAGTTALGDPYLFVHLGSGSKSRLKLVVWSEVLSQFTPLQRQQLRPGTLVSVTGLVSVWDGSKQIVLERPRMIELPSGARVRELLGIGGAKTDAGFRVGDVVEHHSYGEGKVLTVRGSVVAIRFAIGEKQISTAHYPLTIIRRGPRVGAPGPASAPAKTGGTTSPPPPSPQPPRPHVSPPSHQTQYTQDMDEWMELVTGGAASQRPTPHATSTRGISAKSAGSVAHQKSSGSPGAAPAKTDSNENSAAYWTAALLICLAVIAAVSLSLR